MFDTILGLPVHPLVIHAAVVFAPLAALTGIAYALVPRLRPNTRWWFAAFAVITGVTSFIAAESGESLERTLITDANRNTPFAEGIHAHAELGDQMKLFGLAFMVLALAAVFLIPRDPKQESTVVHKVIAALVVLGAIAVLYQVAVTGHSGATAVWG